MTDTDYTDDWVLLTNTPVQAESHLHHLEQAARSIGINMITNQTKFICFKQEGAISFLICKPLKLVDKFTYIGSNISSTENDVIIHIRKTWTAVDRLSIIWKSDLSAKIKWDFFLPVAVLVLLYEYTIWTLTISMERELNGIH